MPMAPGYSGANSEGRMAAALRVSSLRAVHSSDTERRLAARSQGGRCPSAGQDRRAQRSPRPTFQPPQADRRRCVVILFLLAILLLELLVVVLLGGFLLLNLFLVVFLLNVLFLGF